MQKTAPKAVAILLLTCLMSPFASVQAQDAAANFPNKSIRFIAAFAPGAGTDLLGRIVAAELTKSMGQPVIVENRTGAGGIIATQAVLAAPPDGYTLLVGGSAPMVFNPIIYEKLPYDPADLIPVTIIASYPLVIAAKNDLPVKNIKEMVQYAKQKGAAMTYGHVGATFRTQMEWLNTVTGVKMTHVPYKGGGPAVQAAMAGDIDLVVSDLASVGPQHKAGRVRAIAVTTRQRNPILPDVPTLAEQGIDYDGGAFAALGIHRQTPPAIVSKLQQEVAKALNSPEMRERFAQLGFTAGGMSPEEALARVRREIQLYKPVAEAAGIKGAE
ncbi:MAG: tripartite tricarboxylate transporter substrate binding protein [Betaproteobacteria bacterium]|nr:tripartite tricarboxylate transporter substrate binding protein [Betaproteobacteria bacterium]